MPLHRKLNLFAAFIASIFVQADPDLSLYPFLGGVEYDCTGGVDWVIPVGIGSTNKTYPMRIDTSRNLTWIAGSNCTTDEFCMQHSPQLYDPSGSSTSINNHIVKTFNFDPGQSITGDIYNDDVFIGPIEYYNQQFGSAFKVTGFQNVNFVGSVGFGGSLTDTTLENPRFSNSTSGIPPTTLRRMVRRQGGRNTRDGHLITHTPVSPSYGTRPTKRDTPEACSLFYGYNPSVISGSIAWLNVSTCPCGLPEYWRVSLTSVNVGNVIVFYNMPTTVASFDSSVDYILAPKHYIDQIHTALGAQLNSTTNNFEYTCRGISDLTLSFQGYNVSIPAAAWAVQNGNTCYLKIGENQGEYPTEWRLGRVFMKLLVHLYSKATMQVGLALPVQTVVPGIQIVST